MVVLTLKFDTKDTSESISINNAEYIPNIGECVSNPNKQTERYFVRMKESYISEERSHIIVMLTPVLPTDTALHNYL